MVSSSRFWIAPRVERAFETAVMAVSIAEIAVGARAADVEKLIEVRLNEIWLPEPWSAPTCSVNVPEQDGEAVELGVRRDARELGGQLADLVVDRCRVGAGQRAVLRLHRQLADALQDRVHLVVGAFCGLDERDAVHRVALCLVGAVDLRGHLLGDGQAGGVVGGAVDAQAGRQLLHALAERVLRCARLRWASNASTLVLTRRDMLPP